MTYVQLLRLRRALTVYGGIVLTVFLLILIPTHWPGVDIHNDGSGSLPLSILVLVGFCAIIFATVIGTSLNSENDGVEMVWTKPIARDWLALRYIALDLMAIVAAFVLAFILAILILASVGLASSIRADTAWLPTLLLIFGVAFMWYGILQGLTSWQTSRGGMIIGLSWAASVFVLPAFVWLTLRSPVLHEIAMVLNLLNPLSYFTGHNAHVHIGISPPGPSLIPHDIWLRVAMSWGFGLLGSLAAIVGWKRLEV
jgi:hypothetical protein